MAAETTPETPPQNTPTPAPPAKTPASFADAYDLTESDLGGASESAVAAPTVPTAPVGVVTPPVPPSHPAALVRRALEHGLDQSEIADLTTDQLKRDVQLLDRQAAAYARRQPQPEPTKQAAPPPPVDDDLGLDAADLEEFDPRLIKALKTVAKRGANADRLKALEEEVATYRQAHQAQAREQTRQHLDSLFDEIADDYGHIFGKGNSNKLASEQMTPRVKVVTAMEGVRNSFRQMGLEVPSDQELRDMAVKGLFSQAQAPTQTPAPAPTPAPAAAPARSTLTQRQKDWQNQGLAQPTARTSELPKGEARAIKAVAKFQAERGVPEDEEMLNGLPG